MAKLQNKTKDNPKLEQRPLKDGRISLYLEYYLGRTETPVVDEGGNQIRRARTVFIDFLIDPKMKLLPEKVKGDMTKEEKEAIQKNNAKKAAEREKKTAGLKVKPEQLTKDLMRSFTEYFLNASPEKVPTPSMLGSRR